VPNDELKTIQQELKTLADPTIAEHSQRFFKTGKGEYGEGDKFLGIRVPILRKLVKKYQTLSIEQTIILLRSQYHEERLLALLMLVNTFEKGDQTTQKNIYTLYLENTHYINNWDLVDSSAPKIVGAYLFDKNRKPLYTLVKSRNFWKQRISILATFYFIKNNEFEDTLNISEQLLNHKEDLIHKAVGWALREVGNKDISVERMFLDKHYNTMPRTMLRYAIEKFPEQLRQDYLKGNI